MSKRNWIIFSIVSSFISLVFVLLTYFGVIRYIKIRRSTPEEFEKIYGNVEKAHKNRVVISLTTTPERINKLEQVISSLLDQTVRVDEISINLPPDKKYVIPDYIKNSKVIKVYTGGVDYGDMCMVTPCLMRETTKDTIIIFVKDTKIYGKDLIQDLIEASEVDKNCMICSDNLTNDAVLVKSEFFNIDVLEPNKKFPPDVFLKEYLKNKNINVKSINYGENYKV